MWHVDHFTHNDLVEGAHLNDVLKLFVHVTQSKLTYGEEWGYIDGLVSEVKYKSEGVRVWGEWWNDGVQEGVRVCMREWGSQGVQSEGVMEQWCAGESDGVREWGHVECYLPCFNLSINSSFSSNFSSLTFDINPSMSPIPTKNLRG